MEVPAARSIRDIYPESAIAAQTKRWQGLLLRFEAVHGTPATHVSRSPGRVNLIGEHIDYNMYDVLPMAVTADVLIAFAPSPDPLEFRLENVSERFGSKAFRATSEGEVDIDATTLDWANYFKAGLRGAARLLRERHAIARPAGMLVLVDGNVPPGGGLSSSSAFVCASALACALAGGAPAVDKRALVELAIVSERAVGVNGGGMDQSASVFSERGSATLVSFVPGLHATPVPFPDVDPPLAFVVANSFVAADKHVTAPVCYNLRVVECTLAAAVLAKVFGVAGKMPKRDASPLGTSLRGFHDAYFQDRDHAPNGDASSPPEPTDSMARQLEILLDLVDDYLPQEEGYTAEQIAHLLDTTTDDLHDAYMCRFPVRATHFKLRQRATHVLSEALRVLRFHGALLAAAARGREADVPALLAELGRLMNETQDSCRDVYECSCPELDELCALARGAGAVGSRLTGAGWGGGSVHLVPREKVEHVRTAWENGYYRKRWPDITEEMLKDAIVVSEPSSGSYFFRVAGSSVA
jgi:galactokinase